MGPGVSEELGRGAFNKPRIDGFDAVCDMSVLGRYGCGLKKAIFVKVDSSVGIL